ncbi:hypothetical protein ACIPX0_26515 [Streptomyces sp. NPDC090075]|uniref:hypothetical protein n=1 Tax=Streptomyces sp. NPDC090075 TaxID=3365937 RepID=UPI0037F78DD7
MSDPLPRQLSARTDEALAKQIRTLQLAGLSYSQMVKWGVALLSDVYAAAWEYRLVPVGETPRLKSYIYGTPGEAGSPPWLPEPAAVTDSKE